MLEKMKNTKIENTNEVHICGILNEELVESHTLYGEKFYSGKLRVPRKSGTNDIIPILISERLLHVSEKFIQHGLTDAKGLPMPGSTLEIFGQFRSHNNDKRLQLNVFAQEMFIIDTMEQGTVTDYINEIHLYGYICKKSTLRITPGRTDIDHPENNTKGRKIIDIILAVNRRYTSDYIPCICWTRLAMYVSEMNVGEALNISGRIQSRNYEKKVGNETQTFTVYEVSVSRLLND